MNHDLEWLKRMAEAEAEQDITIPMGKPLVCPRCQEITNKYSFCPHIWHSQDSHSSDCNYWVNEPCNCMFGKLEL